MLAQIYFRRFCDSLAHDNPQASPDAFAERGFLRNTRPAHKLEARSMCRLCVRPSGVCCNPPVYEDAPHLIGDCIVRSGYQVQAALWSDNDEKYSLPKGSLLSSHLFNINDRNPKEDLFVKGVSKALAAQEKDSVAHMTLGVHSWQSDAGFKELERILKKHKRTDFWYCTQNEYAAYTRNLKR